MHALIFGGNGWIGQQFVAEALKQNISHRIAVSRVDLEHMHELEQEIDAVAPTHIISLLGRTRGDNFATIDYLEQPSVGYTSSILRVVL